MNTEMPMMISDARTERGAPTQTRALRAQALRQRSVWVRASKWGLTAGCLQATINQGDHWLGGNVDRTVILKSILSPLIGFTLVLFTAMETWAQKTREQQEQGIPPRGPQPTEKS